MGGYCKRSGQIPAFGDWDYANELPITQYFECTRQAGVIRFDSSAKKSKPCVRAELYTVDVKTKHQRKHVPVRKVSRVKENRGGGGGGPLATEEKTAGSACGVTEPARRYQHHHRHSHHSHVPILNDSINNKCDKHQQNDVVYPKRLPVTTIPKPIDEDLYKIPPEILHSSKRKKMPGFFSCLVPACAT